MLVGGTTRPLYGNVLNLAPTDGPLHPADFDAVPGPEAPRTPAASFTGTRSRPRPTHHLPHYALVVYAALIEAGLLDEAALINSTRTDRPSK